MWTAAGGFRVAVCHWEAQRREHWLQVSFASGQAGSEEYRPEPTPVPYLCRLGPNSKGSPAPETAPAAVDHKSPRGQLRLKPVILSTPPYTLMARLCFQRDSNPTVCSFSHCSGKNTWYDKGGRFLFLFLRGVPLGRALLWQKWHDPSDPLPPGWPTWQPRVHLMGLWGALHFQNKTLFETDK